MGISKVVLLVLVIIAIPLLASSQTEETANPPDTEFSPGALGSDLPIITNAADLEEFVNRLVVIRGELSDAEIPRILGVMVQATNVDRNQEVYAVGILGRWNLDPENELPAIQGEFRSDDYTLYIDLAGKVAEARTVPSSEE